MAAVSLDKNRNVAEVNAFAPLGPSVIVVCGGRSMRHDQLAGVGSTSPAVSGPRPHDVLAVRQPRHLAALVPAVAVEAALEGRAGLARDGEGGGVLVRDVRRAIFDGRLGRIRVDGRLAARGGRVGVAGAVDGPDAEAVAPSSSLE